MRILLTGTNGFVGNHIASEMLRRNHNVSCLVRNPEKINIRDVELIQSDLTDFHLLSKVLRKNKFEIVIDSAAKIPAGFNKNEDYFDNILMTRNLLKALRDNPPEYFLKLSTIDVYRIQNGITESTGISPQNYYSLSKRVGEQFVELWSEELNIPACILRLTQIFGTGDRSSKFIPSITKQIKDASKITIYGDGSDRRDYLFVEDAARIVAECCEKRVSGIFNLASGKSYSLNDVVTILREITDKEFQIEYRGRKKPRVDYEFDIKNLINALGEIKFTDLTDALKITYFHEN